MLTKKNLSAAHQNMEQKLRVEWGGCLCLDSVQIGQLKPFIGREGSQLHMPARYTTGDGAMPHTVNNNEKYFE